MAIHTLGVLFSTVTTNLDIERKVLGHEVWQLVEKLPEIRKKVIILIYRDNMSMAGVARELNCNNGSHVKRIHDKAIRDLKRYTVAI